MVARLDLVLNSMAGMLLFAAFSSEEVEDLFFLPGNRVGGGGGGLHQT